jgi:hypothetical protein
MGLQLTMSVAQAAFLQFMDNFNSEGSDSLKSCSPGDATQSYIVTMNKDAAGNPLDNSQGTGDANGMVTTPTGAREMIRVAQVLNPGSPDYDPNYPPQSPTFNVSSGDGWSVSLAVTIVQ